MRLSAALILLNPLFPQDPPKHTLTPIAQAVVDGNLEAARAELEKGADPDGLGEFNRPLINGAVIRGNVKMLDLFLDYGADLENQGTVATPLLYATAQPSKEVLRNLFVAGADPGSLSVAGNGALWAAARKKYPDTIRYHAARGTPIDVPNTKDRQTALMVAATEGDEPTIEALLAAGADPALQDAKGKTALDLAREKGQAAVVRRLEAVAAAPVYARKTHVPPGSDLRAAVAQAGNKALVALAAGNYKASLYVKGVEVTIEGAGDGTVLTADAQPNFVIAAADKAVLTLRRMRLKTSKANQIGVFVQGATVRLEDCVIEDVDEQAIYVESGELDLRSTRIGRVKGIGIGVVKDSRALLRDCVLEKIGGNAIHVERGSRAEVRTTRILESAKVAVAVFSGSSAVVRNSAIDRAATAGILGQQADEVLVSGTTITGCPIAVQVQKTREGGVRDCTLADATRKGGGIVFVDVGLATAAGNRLTGFDQAIVVQGTFEEPVGIARNVLRRCNRALTFTARSGKDRPGVRLTANHVIGAAEFAGLAEACRLVAVGNRILGGAGGGLQLQNGSSGLFEGNLLQGDKASLSFHKSPLANSWLKGDLRRGPDDNVVGARRAEQDLRLASVRAEAFALDSTVDVLLAEKDDDRIAAGRARIEEQWLAVRKAARELGALSLVVEDDFGTKVARSFTAYDGAAAVTGRATIWAGDFKRESELADALRKEAPAVAKIRAAIPPDVLAAVVAGKPLSEETGAALTEALNRLIQGPIFLEEAVADAILIYPHLRAEARALLKLGTDAQAQPENRARINEVNRALLERALPGMITAMEPLAASDDGSPVFIPAGRYWLVSREDASSSVRVDVAASSSVAAAARIPGSVWLKQVAGGGKTWTLARLRPESERATVGASLRLLDQARPFRWAARPDTAPELRADALRRARQALPGVIAWRPLPPNTPPAESSRQFQAFTTRQKAVFRILEAIGEPADLDALGAALAEPLDHANYFTVRGAVELLASLEARFGRLGSGAVVKLLDDPRPMISISAAVALGGRGVCSDRILDLLRRALEPAAPESAAMGPAAWALVQWPDERTAEAMRRRMLQLIEREEKQKHLFTFLSIDNEATPVVAYLVAYGGPEDLALLNRLTIGIGQAEALVGFMENPNEFLRPTLGLGFYDVAMSAAQSFRDRPPAVVRGTHHRLVRNLADIYAMQTEKPEERPSAHYTRRLQASAVTSCFVPNATTAEFRRTIPLAIKDEGDSLIQSMPWWRNPTGLDAAVRRWRKGNDGLEAQFAYAEPAPLAALARAGGGLTPDLELALAAHLIGGLPHTSPRWYDPRGADHRAYAVSHIEGDSFGGGLSGTVSLMARPDGDRLLLWLKIQQEAYYQPSGAMFDIGGRGTNWPAYPMHRYVENGGKALVDRVVLRVGGKAATAVDTGRSPEGWLLYSAPLAGPLVDLQVEVRLKFFDEALTMLWPLHEGENGRRFIEAAAWTPAAAAGRPPLEAARIAARAGRWKEALELYRKVPAGILEAADQLTSRFRYDEAAAWIEEAVGTRPSSELRHERLTYLLRAGRFEDVAAADVPPGPAGLYMKSIANLAQDKPAEALPSLLLLPPEFAPERVLALRILAWARTSRRPDDPAIRRCAELHAASPSPVLAALLGDGKEYPVSSLDEEVRVRAARGYHALGRQDLPRALAHFQSVLDLRQADAVDHLLAAALIRKLKP